MRRRSFRSDAGACIQRLKPGLQVFGSEYIPCQGPCVLTINHYSRPGFRAEWIALAVSATIPVEMQWIMTGEWTFPGRWYAFLGQPLSRLVLSRLAHVYGYTNMPPMPPRPKDVEARARAVRMVMNYMKHSKSPVLGFAPEGRDSSDGRLARPASGVGRFGLLLAGLGSVFVPVGAYEAEGAFFLRFGPGYQLNVPPDIAPGEKDHLAAQTMMKQIAKLLPKSLQGEFA